MFVSAERPALLHNIKLAGADVDRVQVLQNAGFVANVLVVTLAKLSTASAAPVVFHQAQVSMGYADEGRGGRRGGREMQQR